LEDVRGGDTHGAETRGAPDIEEDALQIRLCTR
jgi:hypothetical protein